MRSDWSAHALRLGAAAMVAVLLPSVASGAHFARVFGTKPIPISVSASGSAGDGPSGSPAISGDDRRATYTAFDSSATNLVARDGNGAEDVFLYRRPSGRRGVERLGSGPARPAGQLIRVSVTSTGGEANGASTNPAIDGSLRTGPRCVAFQSQATNLASGDSAADWDVYVRDLRNRTTRLLSANVAGDALDPAISGDCRQVAFTAGGRIYVANGLKGGRARFLTSGTNPDISWDGSAITWQRGKAVFLRRGGRTARVGAGRNPQVSDPGASRSWAVVFNAGPDVYFKVFGPAGGTRRTVLVSRGLRGTSHHGGLTAFTADRGIVVFTNTRGRRDTLYYLNVHSGNIDDLASGPAGSISAVSTSARANFVAFASTARFTFDRNGKVRDVFLKHLTGGQRL